MEQHGAARSSICKHLGKEHGARLLYGMVWEGHKQGTEKLPLRTFSIPGFPFESLFYLSQKFPSALQAPKEQSCLLWWCNFTCCQPQPQIKANHRGFSKAPTKRRQGKRCHYIHKEMYWVTLSTTTHQDMVLYNIYGAGFSLDTD